MCVCRKELEAYSRHGATTCTEDEEVESLMQRGVARPDLLATTRPYYGGGDTGGSLMQEIAEKEGMASPLLRKEYVLQPSPFLRTRAASMRKKKSHVGNLKSQAALSLSLPNLADIDNLDTVEYPLPHPSSNRFSVLLPSQL